MKEKFPWKDMLVLGGALAAAIAGVAAIQAVSGRIDGVASMVFVLAAFFVSMYTEGYLWGVAASVIGMLAVNFAFRSPYFAFNFTLPENLFSGAVMLVVSIMTSTLTTRVKKTGAAADGERDGKRCGRTSCGPSPTTCAPR